MNLDMNDHYKINHDLPRFCKADYPRFFDVCPICGSDLIEFLTKDNSSVTQVCTQDPPKRDLFTSYQAKSHFFHELKITTWKNKISSTYQEVYVRQAGTDPSKYNIHVSYHDFKGKKATIIRMKHYWTNITIDRWWNIGLTGDYREIFKRAQAMQNLTA